MDDAEDPPFTASVLALNQPDITFLLRYWLDRRDGDKPPLRRSMDPADFPQLLPRIAVMEVARSRDGAICFRYRLTGSEIVARIGRDPTGYYFSEIYEGEDLVQTERLYTHLHETGEAFASRTSYAVGRTEENLLLYDRLILPLRSREELDRADQFMLLIVVVGQTGAFQPVGSFWEAKR